MLNVYDFRNRDIVCTLSVAGTKEEVVLDFVIERKRMDDLAGSIVDGRFKEQKVSSHLQCKPISLNLNSVNCLL